MNDTFHLPDSEHLAPGQRRLGPVVVQRRRETTLLVLSGLFLGTLSILNVLGLSRFIDLSFAVPGVGWEIPVHLPVGVLPYPLTFLCTDFISELYGRRRANVVVWVGLLLNGWLVFVFWVGGVLPVLEGTDESVFFAMRRLAFGAVSASMIAYLVAQFVDVYLFHFWKKWTRGRHLWLRNNGSTLVSQLIDSILVILITYCVADFQLRDDQPVAGQLLTLILSGYAFKVIAALIDTAPFYFGVHALGKYLRLPPPAIASERSPE